MKNSSGCIVSCQSHAVSLAAGGTTAGTGHNVSENRRLCLKFLLIKMLFLHKRSFKDVTLSVHIGCCLD